MSNALCVNISKSFAALNPVDSLPQSEPLRIATTVAWDLKIENAANVEFLFGVVRGEVKSAYRVRPAAEWPRETGKNRWVVLTEGPPFKKSAFASLSFPGLQHFKYAQVVLDDSGVFRLQEDALEQ
jgi:hypothetical protein